MGSNIIFWVAHSFFSFHVGWSGAPLHTLGRFTALGRALQTQASTQGAQSLLDNEPQRSLVSTLLRVVPALTTHTAACNRHTGWRLRCDADAS